MYHHTPLLPYLYSVFSDLGFASYVLLRYVSVILTLTLLVLVYFHVHKFTEDKASANFAVFLIMINGMYIDWSSIITMFPLTNLLFYIAFLSASFLLYNFSKRYLSICFFVGLCSGLCVNTRLSYAFPALALFISIAYYFYKLRMSLRMSLIYLTFFFFGFSLSSPLSIYYLTFYPEYFIYGVFQHNFEAQQVQWESGTNLLLWLKFIFLPQNFILAALALFCLKVKFMGKIFAYILLIALLIAHSPGYFVNMYLMVLIPFAAFIAGLNYKNFAEMLSVRSRPVLRFVLGIYAVSIFLGIPHFKHVLFGDTLEPNIIQLKEIVDYERSIPGTTILASWDAFSIFSGKSNVLKNELLYSFTFGKLTTEEIQKFSFPRSEEIDRLIKNKFFDVIVLHEGIPGVLLTHEENIKSTYKLNRTFRNICIYTKN